ncbi:hypothetical protein [Nonomuraea basaltis]|uniref:hypothetical protein n=1 Tax=Nonomuraea basaltis TaxID=2495887 RepID=UPI00110C4874|nr:hypothetical protein [Nonomuraea basaltis]TMR99591.1 hypothetical protein EJK15_07190 [Nonomuraea basaltis]
MTTTTATLTPRTQATPVQLGEQLVQLLRAADACTAQVIARDPGVYGHLRKALLELLRTQGWGSTQADEVITAVMMDPSATLQGTMLILHAPVVTRKMAEQVRVAVCRQFGITPDAPPEHGPDLRPEWDDDNHQWVITWASDGWTYTFPHGGEDENGCEYPEVPLPPGVWVERINDFAISVNAR